MNSDSSSASRSAGRARWIAAGFLGAFAASILTVIYTGLMVEGSQSEFDSGFRSVTLEAGETRAIDLLFNVETTATDARLEVSLPLMLEPADRPGTTRSSRGVTLRPGENDFAVEVRARSVGSGYLIARLEGDAPIALERVFVTVVESGEAQ